MRFSRRGSYSSSAVAALVLLTGLVCATPASAQYTARFSTLTNGAVTFTGNSLGLDGAPGQNGQGTRGGIATFITTDTTQQDVVPPPTTVPQYPFGTTSNWQLNRSTADLRLPAGARVLRAELIWGGTFADESFEGNVAAFRDNAVSFTTPAGSFSVSPDPATARNVGTLEGSRCAGARECYYVRTADVTALVAAGGGGTYATGAVPATQSTGDSNRPSAGWTLAVVYEDFNQPIRNLSLFLGFEKGTQASAPASVSGFCTPTSGTVSGRLAVTAVEGDPGSTGDSMLFGPTASLSVNNNSVQGPRNPQTNFFASQILNDTGNLDTSGTFGTRNHTPGSPSVGARHGWDITNVDVSNRLRNNQTSAFAQGTTNGEGYWIMALALQIDVGAPRFPSTGSLTVDRATAVVGDVLTYTAVVDNSTGTTNANNVVFFDTLAPGTSFVAGSFRINGVTQAGADPTVGVPLGTLAVGATATVTFQVRVDAALPTHQRVNQARWTFDFVSCAGQPAQQGVTETNAATTIVPVADLVVSKMPIVRPVIAGSNAQYLVTVRNDGPSPVTGAMVSDPGTTPALTGISWTCSSNAAATCPASGTGPLSAPVTLNVGGSATFVVSGTLPANTPPGAISNTSTITPPAGVPDLDLSNNVVTAGDSIVRQSDLAISITGPASAQRGTNVTYTITVTNGGVSDVVNTVVSNPTPAGLTLVTPISGPCAAAPGCALAVGGSATMTVTYAIPPDYSGPDPFPIEASVADSSSTDPAPSNNSDEATTALDAPVINLSVTKTNGVSQVTAGLPTTYTITVTNAGPAAAIGSRLFDTFSATRFDVASVQWTCAASGSSSCSAPSGTGNIDTLVNVFPGAGNEVIVTAQAPVLSTASGSVGNSAIVTRGAGISESSTADNISIDLDTITTVGDLSVTKIGPATIVPGTTVDYTVTVANAGPSTARNVVFAEAPEEGAVADAGRPRPELIQTIVTPPGAACENQALLDDVTGTIVSIPVCTIPQLEAGGTRVFTVRMVIPTDFSVSAGALALTNVAQLQSAALDSDPDSTDHRGIVTSTVTPLVDIAVTKSGPAAVVAGTGFSYYVDISNNGPSAWADVRAQDTLPAGLTYTGGDGPCVTAFLAGQLCMVGALAPGQHSTTRIDVLVPADYAGPSTITNTVVALPQGLPAGQEPDTTNNQAMMSTSIIPDHADVGIVLSGPASVAPGGTIEYVATVTNYGPGPAFNVKTSDVVPAGVIVIGGSVPPGTVDCVFPTQGATNVLSCVTPVLQVGESIEYHVIAQLGPDAAPGSLLTSLATVTSTTPDHNPSNKQDTIETRVTGASEAGLSIEKTDAPDPVILGSNVTYTLTVRSQGPATATNVTVTDTLPPSFTLVSATPSQGSCAGATCTLGSIASYGSATIVIVATATAQGVFTNTATVSATETDPVLDNNTVDQVTTVATSDEADLLIEKLGPTIEGPGSTTFYTIRVTNRGPAAATSVRVTDTLPAGLTFVGNTGACVTAFPCDFDHLEPGQTVVINTAFTVDPSLPTPTTITNSASVATQTIPDPDLSNNTSSVTTEIQAGDSADLVVTKVDSPDGVIAGTQISFALSVINRGPATAPNVVLTDTLPAGMTLISATPTQGSCTGTTTITCNLGAMASGTAVEVGILAIAPPGATVTTNTVTGTSPAPDPDPGNNTDGEDTNILPPVADLSVTKTLATPAIPGLPATYEIVVRNNGPSLVAGATVVDALPVVLGGVTWTCTADPGSACGAASGSTTLATTVNLEPGDRAIFVLTGTIAPSATGVLANTVTVDVPAGATDPNPADNVALSSVVLTPSADLQVMKSGPAQATPGTTISYTLTVTNAGPSDAVDVTLTDPTPAGLAFVSGGGACAAYPCALGTVPAAGTVVATVTFAVPPGYTTPDPIVNVASVSSATTPDPAAGNNTATAMSAIAAPVTDLSITKTNGASTVVPGATTTYTITVSNAGPSNAIGATVTDAFPTTMTGVSWTCASTTGGICGAPAGSGDINTTVDIPAGSSVVFTATATVDPTAVGVLVNTATVTPGPGQSDPSSANNTDSDQLTPQADLAIAKIGPASAVVGSPFAYTITVTNNGPSNAANVVVEDPVPAGAQFVSNAGDCTTPFPCALGTLAPGASRTITATFTLPTAIGLPLPITNVATVSTTTDDPNPANDTAQAETALNRDADIEVTKSATPSTGVFVGDTIVFTVNVLNRGPNPATSVVVTDNLPAGFDLVSATPTQGVYDAASGAWQVGDLALNATAQLELTTTVTTPGSITNLAIKTGAREPDPVTGNDSAAATINAVPAADLAVEKSESVAEPLVGETVTFTVRVTNRGPSPATGVTMADALPAGLTFVSATPSQGAYDPSSGVWTIGPLNLLAEATLTLTATVDQPGPLTNNAAIAGRDQADRNPLNDSAAASINATANADLRVTKAASNPAPAVGSDVTYTIAVTNLGPNAVTSAEVLDLLPAGVTFVSATPSQGTYDTVSGVWTVGAIAVSGTETLSLVGRVTQLGAIDNTAARQTSGPVDPNPVNDGATVGVTPGLVADLVVIKTPTASGVAAGGPVTWTITVTNRGPSAVTGAAVTDTFPLAVTGVQWTCTASAGAACTTPAGTGPIAAAVDLAANATATFVATGVVDPAATGIIDNVATVAAPAGATDPDPTNNTASGPVQVTGLSDLQVTGAGPASAVPGAAVTYTFTILNQGPSVASVATFNVPTPAGLSLDSVAGACVTLPCSLGAVPPGQSRLVTIVYTIPLAYQGSSSVVVTGTASSPTDGNLTNNSASVTTAVATLSDVSIVKLAPIALPDPGGLMVFELVVANNGPRDAIGVVVTDPTPAGLAFVGNAGACTTPFPCQLGTLAAGATRRIESTFRFDTGASIVNVASVTSATPDPDLANNQATSATPPAAGISVTKVRSGPLVPGQSVRYVITVTNNGPADVDSVTLTDPTPPGLAFVVNTGACTVAFPCTLGRLVVGESQVVYSTFLVLPETSPGAEITNEVTAASPTPDPTPVDNVARDTGPVTASTDTDDDGMPDDCETAAGLDPNRDDASEDPDGDGLTNAQECEGGTHPRGFFTYYLPEGAESSFFGTRFAIGSLDSANAARVRARRHADNGSETGVWFELPPDGRTVVDSRSALVTPFSFATVLESDRALLAERTMDMASGSAHADTAVSALSPTWYFAEGATTNGFRLYYMLHNPHPDATTAAVTWLRNGAAPITRMYQLLPHSRTTIYINGDPDLVDHDLAAVVEAGLPIAAARSMYLDWRGELMVAGASASGVGTLDTEWFFAEGATGSFDLWLLLANFAQQTSEVEVEYLIDSSQRLVRPLSIPPRSRLTVRVNAVDPALADSGSIAMHVRGLNGVPFVAERAMWWPGGGWYEGHHGTPVAQTAPRWRFGEGPNGDVTTYLLLANFGATAGDVVVTLTYDDGSASARVLPMNGYTRLTLPLAQLVPESAGRRFRIDVASEGAPLPLVAERSTYETRSGRLWAAGTSVVGTPVP